MLKKLFIGLLCVLLLGSVLIVASLLIWGVQSDPLVGHGRTLAYDDVDRIKQLLKQNDPRKLQPGEVKTVTCLQQDVNMFFHYAFSQTPIFKDMAVAVAIDDRSAEVKLTLPLQENIPAGLSFINRFGKYLNIRVRLAQGPVLIDIDRLDIGALSIPGPIPQVVIAFGHRLLSRVPLYRDFAKSIESIKKVGFYKERLVVTYQWNPDVLRELKDQGKDLLLPEAERDRLVTYRRELSELSHSLKGDRFSLTELMVPLFRLARERSLDSVNDPRMENRAAILALALYANKRNLGRLAGDDDIAHYPRMRYLALTLHGRKDLTLHFLVSAAITVASNSGLANLAGVFKEVSDSKGGSGFSFADLAADKAGVRFGECATQSEHSASKLLENMAEGLQERDFMPRIDALPEGIMELEFKHNYRDLDSRAYQQVDDEIARRLAECRLYR